MSVQQETLGEYNYDPEAGAAYIKVSDGKVASTSTFGCILIDQDDHDEIVGVEVLDEELESLPVELITDTLHLDEIQRAQLERVSQIVESHAQEDQNEVY